MNPKLLNTLSGLVASGALLTLGLLCGGTDVRLRDAKEGSPLAGTLDAAIEAEAALPGGQVQAKPRRHGRGTLSMPYFSFAQSLRPRG